MVIYKSTGFPKRVSEHIEIPSIEELLITPFAKDVLIEDYIKNGNEFQKEFANKFPLLNTKKYVYVSQTVTLQNPLISPVINAYAMDREWHVDGDNSLERDDIVFHLFANKTSSMTDFNAAEFEIEVENGDDLIRKINTDEEVIKLLKPQQIEPNKFYTFDNADIHRAHRCTNFEFRFFTRIIETDVDLGQGGYGLSVVFDGSREAILNIHQKFKNGYVDELNFFMKK